MGNMSGMFSFAFWVIRALKCEVVIFPKFQSAGVPVRPFGYLDTPILIIACAPCSRVCDEHAQRDITRFASCVNHVTMTSPVFAFHSCHVGMRWHDIISVRLWELHVNMVRITWGRRRHDIIVFPSRSHRVDDVIMFRS